MHVVGYVCFTIEHLPLCQRTKNDNDDQNLFFQIVHSKEIFLVTNSEDPYK
jgi:hypothetical protein